VSLNGFNRALVRAGLEQINRAPRPGIQALAALETRDQPLTASSLSFGMIPRLNAPGRLGQPEVAIQTLIESKPDIASQQAAKLQELNNERRRLEAELSSEAMTQVMASYQAGQKLVVVASTNWHEGIRGIIASRIAHQLGVPAIVFTLVDGEARGSGRSVGAVKLFSALSAVSDLTLRFGGHESAVGVTIRPHDIALFSERLEAELAKQAEESFNPPTTVDAQLDLSELDLQAIQQLSLLEPFGHDNPQPLFVSRPLTISSQRLVGNQGQHLSFTVNDGQASQSAIWFNCPEIEGLTENPELLELAFEPTVAPWRGQQTLRLRVTAAFQLDPDTLLERAFPELKGSLYPAQEQALELLGAGHSPLCLMPTGRGKSLVFQLYASQLALTRQAVSLFVYPLRALINDQQQHLVNRLSAIGLNSRVLCGLSSAEERNETYQALASGQVAVILTTPEFLLLHALQIAQATTLGHSQVAFIAIDEAHHITADGITQRPAYNRLAELRSFFPTAQVLAATATANQETALQISQNLGLDSLVIDTSRRPNLKLNDQRDAPDRLLQVTQIVEQKTPVVVYVYSRDEARFLVRDLRKALPEQALSINYYHAGLLSELRQTIEQDFSKGESSCLVCTSAFGEGINIANIRHLVLYHPPFSRTALNQLTGRAGRDGLQSTIHLLFNQQDITNSRKLLKDSLPSYEGMAALYRYLRALAKTTDSITLPDQTLAIAVERQDAKHPLSASQINLTLRIFAELGLIDIRQTGLLRQLVVHADQQKVELQASSIYLEAYDELSEFDAFSEWLMSAQSLELEQFIQGPILPITDFSTGSAPTNPSTDQPPTVFSTSDTDQASAKPTS
ncbi:MAG: DEAD/DEAH box helicase, partial [Coriobacteriales bacterium]|nr:DEAD/DEAH box helicase [Coriobacteriales bacterium]